MCSVTIKGNHRLPFIFIYTHYYLYFTYLKCIQVHIHPERTQIKSDKNANHFVCLHLNPYMNIIWIAVLEQGLHFPAPHKHSTSCQVLFRDAYFFSLGYDVISSLT